MSKTKTKTKTKTIWIMSADSESGDHYTACKIWNYKPSQEEIDRVRIELDATTFDPEDHSEKWEGFVVVDDQKWITYILNYNIEEREIEL